VFQLRTEGLFKVPKKLTKTHLSDERKGRGKMKGKEEKMGRERKERGGKRKEKEKRRISRLEKVEKHLHLNSIFHSPEIYEGLDLAETPSPEGCMSKKPHSVKKTAGKREG